MWVFHTFRFHHGSPSCATDDPCSNPVSAPAAGARQSCHVVALAVAAGSSLPLSGSTFPFTSCIVVVAKKVLLLLCGSWLVAGRLDRKFASGSAALRARPEYFAALRAL